METYNKPAHKAPEKGNKHEYEFTPIDPVKPVYYGVCTQKEAADHAESYKVSMYRRIK